MKSDHIYQDLALCTESMTMTGTSGEVRLNRQVFAIAERLMRRPAAIVTISDLVAALYDDPDLEPSEPVALLRMRMSQLRILIQSLSSKVVVRSERNVGYQMMKAYR